MPEGTERSEPAPWSQFAAEEPGLAQRIEARFAANLHHVIGTLRIDRSPRLSGTEVRIADGEVRIGMMSGSHKLRDVERDPRVEVHSAPTEDDLARGDAKLTGVLVGAAAIAESVEGVSFRLAITRASLVRVEGNALVFTIWSPGEAVRSLRRS